MGFNEAIKTESNIIRLYLTICVRLAWIERNAGKWTSHSRIY